MFGFETLRGWQKRTIGRASFSNCGVYRERGAFQWYGVRSSDTFVGSLYDALCVPARRGEAAVSAGRPTRARAQFSGVIDDACAGRGGGALVPEVGGTAGGTFFTGWQIATFSPLRV